MSVSEISSNLISVILSIASQLIPGLLNDYKDLIDKDLNMY